MSKVVTFKIVRDNEWDEWHVQYLIDGKVDEAKTYYTEDYQDAVSTMLAMKKELDVQQHQRSERIGTKLNIKLNGKGNEDVKKRK